MSIESQTAPVRGSLLAVVRTPMAAANGTGEANGALDVMNDSEPTLPAFSRRSSPQFADSVPSQQVTNPVAALRQLGAARRAVIVVNELAPQARDADWKKLFQQTLGAQTELAEVRVRHFEGAVAAARGAAAWGAQLVIAVGGDGTVNACVNGIGDSPTRLAVVPAGTANDLAHLVGQHGIPTADAMTMSSWERKDLDTIDVNGIRYYSAGGMGWVADVAARANFWRAGGPIRRWLLARLGSVIYTVACVAIILGRARLGAHFTCRYQDAITGKDEELSLDGYGVIATSSARVGRSFHLLSQSKMDDGIFELIFFPRTSRWRLLKTVLAAKAGRLLDIPEIRWVQTRKATVEASRMVRFFGDGEILEHGCHFELSVGTTPLRIMAPVAAEAVAEQAHGTAVETLCMALERV
jgi:diacylglycerol kinase (ATP)